MAHFAEESSSSVNDIEHDMDTSDVDSMTDKPSDVAQEKTLDMRLAQLSRDSADMSNLDYIEEKLTSPSVRRGSESYEGVKLASPDSAMLDDDEGLVCDDNSDSDYQESDYTEDTELNGMTLDTAEQINAEEDDQEHASADETDRVASIAAGEFRDKASGKLEAPTQAIGRGKGKAKKSANLHQKATRVGSSATESSNQGNIMQEQTLHQMTIASLRNRDRKIHQLEGRLDIVSSVLKQIVNDAPPQYSVQAWNDKELVKKDWKIFDKFREGRKSRTAVYYDAETNRWKFHGIAYPLYHHQMRGVQRMRKWEKAPLRRGGLLAYPPGSGKTIMSITNIVNGRPTVRQKSARRKQNAEWIPTTLIIVPKSLQLQWMNEITKFMEPRNEQKDFIPHFCTWKQFEQLLTENIVKLTNMADVEIILATYEDVMRSQKLQDVHWLRIIPDEGHRIKNWKSNGGQLFGKLKADFRWLLSGTPITNRLSEFYGYLHFLQNPIAAAMSEMAFVKQYNIRKNPGKIQRLGKDTLIKISHTDIFLGEKVMALPPAYISIVKLEFDDTTRWLHERLRIRMKQRLEKFIKDQNKDSASYLETPLAAPSDIDSIGKPEIETLRILTDIMRLRQFSDHPAMIQSVLEEYLTKVDILEFTRRAEQVEAQGKRPAQQKLLNMRNQLIAISDRTETFMIEEDESIEETPVQACEWDHMGEGINKAQGRTETDLFKDLKKDSGGAHGWSYNYTAFAKSLRSQPAQPKCALCDAGSSREHPLLFQLRCHHIVNKSCWDRQSTEADVHDEELLCPICGVSADIPPTPIAMSVPKRQKTVAGRDYQPSTPADVLTATKKLPTDSEDQVRYLRRCEAPDLVPSAKSLAFKAEMLNIRSSAPTDKVVVFTYFTELTDFFEQVCQVENWEYLKYDSKLDGAARDKLLTDFGNVNTEADMDGQAKQTNILLMAIGVGSEGLNLTMANRVLIFSPWWHESKEIQAFCRIWRLGQGKPCFLKRFIMANSVEEHMLNVQRAKQADIDAVMMGKAVSEEEPQIRTTIKYLFGIDYKGPIKVAKSAKRKAISDEFVDDA